MSAVPWRFHKRSCSTVGMLPWMTFSSCGPPILGKVTTLYWVNVNFWFLFNVLVILYPMYLYKDCDLSSMVRTAN
ncbi:hypothetical protein RGQ29_014867 [Quercus rubra]|uniref:Uncharacterized protein n=1 Tax=Quercus rubra TaxID=3512 RepID=A0AAN7FMN3_QUERU|nr:hypothetical protein RGQ29_014867 [Quercus rubra]